MTREEWLPIDGYESSYEISSHGRVRTFCKATIPAKDGVLKPRGHSNGYLRVCLRSKDFYIHRLVAKAFIKNTENKKVVNHIDFNRKNNMVENLEWVTTQQNINHSKPHRQYKEKHHQVKTSLRECQQISDMVFRKVPVTKIAKQFKVCEKTVYNIKNGVHWSNHGQNILLPDLGGTD